MRDNWHLLCSQRLHDQVAKPMLKLLKLDQCQPRLCRTQAALFNRHKDKHSRFLVKLLQPRRLLLQEVLALLLHHNKDGHQDMCLNRDSTPRRLVLPHL
jgi:hypothetical protein